MKIWRQRKDSTPLDRVDVPVSAAGIELRRYRGATYLVRPGQRQALRVNETGLRLWELCDGSRSVESIIALLQWYADNDDTTIARDVLRALREFQAHGFVSRRTGSSESAIEQLFAAPAIASGARPKVYAVGYTFNPAWSSNSSRKPKRFDWTNRRDRATVPITVCMGHRIPQCMDLPGRKIAWLIESPAISQLQGIYAFIEENLDQVLSAFEIILSPDRALCALDPKFRYHLAGSNLPWVPEDDYRIYPKSRLCSMFASPKLMVPGHHVRHEYAQRLKDSLDLFGGACGSPKLGGNVPYPAKKYGLAPYMFSVTMENCRTSLYYTEKIMDCFVTGTVPVYWGADDIGDVFDERGIITLDEDFDIRVLDAKLYDSLSPYITNNFEIAKNIDGADDLLFDSYIDG